MVKKTLGNGKNGQEVTQFKKGWKGGPGRKKVVVTQTERLAFIDEKVEKGEDLTPEDIRKFRDLCLDFSEKGNGTYARIIADKFMPDRPDHFAVPLKIIHVDTIEDVLKEMMVAINAARTRKIQVRDMERLVGAYKEVFTCIRDSILDEARKNMAGERKE